MISIIATSYLNTLPFVYGIEKSGYLKNYKLLLDVPSACAEGIINSKSDAGLIPVASLHHIPDEYKILNGFCLGTNGKVNTVLLLSRVPLTEVKEIHLDIESRTSVRLVTVLADNYWNLKDIKWTPIKNIKWEDYSNYESIVAIGDKTFKIASDFEYKYDLAEEWYRFTKLPFVFACWVIRKDVPEDVQQQLIQALDYGVVNRIASVKDFRKLHKDYMINIDIEEYVDKYMNYEFDEPKHKALKLFQSYLDIEDLKT